MSLYYADTSAVLKLLVTEEHSDAMTAFYQDRLDEDWVSSDLLRIETTRVLHRLYPQQLPEAVALLDSFSFLPVDEEIVRGAIAEPEPGLRSLDAIHLATARLLGGELDALVSYDDRLNQAAKAAGIPAASPGRSSG